MKLVESGRISRLARRWSNAELRKFAGWFPVYVFALGSKHPERWRARFPAPVAIKNAANRVAGERSIVQGVRGALRLLRGK